jgi:hypothetical protein
MALMRDGELDIDAIVANGSTSVHGAPPLDRAF